MTLTLDEVGYWEWRISLPATVTYNTTQTLAPVHFFLFKCSYKGYLILTAASLERVIKRNATEVRRLYHNATKTKNKKKQKQEP